MAMDGLNMCFFAKKCITTAVVTSSMRSSAAGPLVLPSVAP